MLPFLRVAFPRVTNAAQREPEGHTARGAFPSSLVGPELVRTSRGRSTSPAIHADRESYASITTLQFLTHRLRREPVAELPAALQRLAAPSAAELVRAGQGVHLVVVLGVPSGPDGSLSLWQAARVQRAQQVADASPHALVIVSGGATPAAGIFGNPKFVEADIMAETMHKAGVPAERLFAERRSKTTVENAAFVADIWNSRLGGPQQLGLVTVVAEPFHGVRALRIFAALLRDEPSPPILHFAPTVRMPTPPSWSAPPTTVPVLQRLSHEELLNLTWTIEQQRRILFGF